MPERLDIVIIGASIAGLTIARALHDQGHDITVIERAATPPETIEEAHANWPRPTVPQSLHSHTFAALGLNLLKDRDPGTYHALLAAGAMEVPMPGLASDHRMNLLACRRSTFELVYRREVLRQSGIRIRYGVCARGLRLAGRRITAVVAESAAGSHVLKADLVIDASGRRSPAAAWLQDAGVKVPADQVSSSELTCYSRFYRQMTPQPPAPLERGAGSGDVWTSHSGGLHLGDNQTFAISICVLPSDQQMRALRGAAAFTAAAQATALLAPWIQPEVSQPISGVSAMGSLDNTLRGVAVDPPVDGLLCLGDAACTTNPLYGRGISLALAHAYDLAEVITEHPHCGPALTSAAGALAWRLFTPWYLDSVANDRRRATLWHATVTGTPLPPPATADLRMLIKQAAAVDPVVGLQLMRVTLTLDTPDTLETEEFKHRVKIAAQTLPTSSAPVGPSRADLVEAVAAAAARELVKAGKG